MGYATSFTHQISCFLRSDWYHSVKSKYDKTSERKAEMRTDRHVWMLKSPLRDDAIMLRFLSYLLKVLGLSVHHFQPGIYHCSLFKYHYTMFNICVLPYIINSFNLFAVFINMESMGGEIPLWKRNALIVLNFVVYF